MAGLNENLLNLTNFALCDVLSVDDESEGRRIKVRIPSSLDSEKTIDELPYCFPLLPKLIGVNPKVGEKVFVFFQSPNSKESFRLFVGPIIMQDYMTNYAPGSTTSITRAKITGREKTTLMTPNLLSKKGMGPFEAPSRNSKNEGSIPKREDIVIKGRANTDIVLKDSETQIRCGFIKSPYDTDIKSKLNYNPVDQAYIQLKYKKSKDDKENEFNSSINIVADRINLLSYDSGSYIDNLGEKDLVGDKQMEMIFQRAHALPYGDELIAFLKEFVRVFKEHTHPYYQMPPCLNSSDTESISANLDDMLSKSIRIN
jgi:hypothetical protein